LRTLDALDTSTGTVLPGSADEPPEFEPLVSPDPLPPDPEDPESFEASDCVEPPVPDASDAPLVVAGFTTGAPPLSPPPPQAAKATLRTTAEASEMHFIMVPFTGSGRR
jgi:hypothetical protein